MNPHLNDTACHICGIEEENHTSVAHKFWSNAEARTEFESEPNAEGTEARYVAEHRSY